MILYGPGTQAVDADMNQGATLTHDLKTDAENGEPLRFKLKSFLFINNINILL